MRTDKYILGGPDGKTPIPCDNLLEWARWYGSSSRIVKQEHIGHFFISTIFLGLDHNWGALLSGHEEAPPILFETMAFHHVAVGRNLEIQERCCTWDEAIAQHDRIAGEMRKAALS